MFTAKAAALTLSYLNGLNPKERREMVSYEDIGSNIIQERCGMVSNLDVAIDRIKNHLFPQKFEKLKSTFNFKHMILFRIKLIRIQNFETF